MVAVTYYFDRYRGVASGIASAGTGVGYIVVPMVLNSLIAHFDTPVGWRYAILVFSLILTGATFVNGLVLRPLEIEVARLEDILDIEDMRIHSNSHLDEIARSGLETIRESEVLGFTVGLLLANPSSLYRPDGVIIIYSHSHHRKTHRVHRKPNRQKFSPRHRPFPEVS